MTEPKPIYTFTNCHPAYQLNWSLALFCRADISGSDWLAELKVVTEKDGVRILSYRQISRATCQFLISTTPEVAPESIVRSVKGRLQYIIRDKYPKAFHRNYSIHSVGTAKRETIENYVSSQLNHHRMADPRVREKLSRFQINRPEVDLSRTNRSTHGEYTYNLHLVLVNESRWTEIRDEVLEKTNRTLLGVSEKKGHLLSRVGVFPDHLHMTLGCNITESPGEVALVYLNNLAYVEGMKPVYQFGYYVGTFGEYDLGVVR